MLFIDTGAFLAHYVQADQFHTKAQRVWRRLEKEGGSCCTSNHVLDETFTLLGRRTTYQFAAERARVLLSSHVLKIFRSDAGDELQAVSIFEKCAGQQVSFTDSISFVLMRRYGIERVFTYDRHFSLAGFKIVS